MATPQQRDRLGKRVRKAREARGWAQKDLARAAGVDAGVLSRLESGSSEPSLSTLHRVRMALALDDETFLAWIDIIKPDRVA